MLGDIVELTVVVRDLDAAIDRFTRLFGLKVHHRAESKEFGFKNAILPTGIGHIELLQPTDPDKAVGRFLAKHGEGVYLVDSEGRRYLDFVSGIAVNALGYGDAGLRQAMHAAADGLIHVSNLYSTLPGQQLASTLVERSFRGVRGQG